MAKTVIDIAYDRNIDFKAMKASGMVDGVIIRAGFGKNNIDAGFKKNIEGAINAGFPVGVYWFSYAYTKTMAEKEAEYCLNAIAPYKVTMPVFFDWEYDSYNWAVKNGVQPDKKLVTDMYSAFLDKVLTAGYKAGYYANPDYLNCFIDEKQIDGYYKWFALYNNPQTFEPKDECDLWQWGICKEIPGTNMQKVDMNICYNESLLKEPKNDDKTVEELAYEVIRGEWGVGEDRKQRLYEAGYDYNEVQAEVNRIMSGNAKPEQNSNLKVGDKVMLTKDAVVYGTSQRFADFVYNRDLYVRSINKNKVLISIYESGDVTGYVDKKYLIKI